MGLFGSIAGIVGGLVGGNAAKKAGKAQAQSIQLGIDEQRRRFDLSRADQMPWMQAGQSALGDILDLLGLNGGGAQGSSIEALKSSPLFESLFRTGEDTILNNASATGGLRGGNFQRSLADFGSDTLSQVIQQQLGNLGGISAAGAGSAQNLGALGQNSASAIANLLGQQGQAKAGGILGKANGLQTAIGGFGDLLEGGGGLTKLLSGIKF